MKLMYKLRTNLAANIIGTLVLLLLVFSWLVSVIGYISFTNAFKREYSETTYHMANTAATLVNADRIDDYLADGGSSPDYLQSKEYLDTFCVKMNLSIVYIIKVDTTDYKRFTAIFDSVGSDTPYTPWEIGYQQDTTNDEYAELYRNIYENNLELGTVYRTKDLKGAPPHITTLTPLKNSQGKVVAIMCIQRPMKELKDSRRPYLINIAITTNILAISAAIFADLFVRRELIKPVRRVVSETVRFAKENKKGEELGAVSKIYEISSLGLAIDTMETDMLNYIDNLTEVTAEKERIGAELSVASIIQENSLPNIFPAFPERKEFDIYASMTPAKEVGGDFYNFLLIDNDHLAFVIGDVSGKGIPAALFMMVTNILISEKAHTGITPADVLTEVNNGICEHNKADMFVTLWLGVLEISTGKVIASNAGHDDAMIYRSGGEFELLKTKHGLVVGAMQGLKYKNFEFQLGEGDKLFLYTDGVPEATDKDNRMFTIERTVNTLNENKEMPPHEILDAVKESVNKFVGDAPQFDDLTMLCIQMNGKKEDNMLTVDATIENLAAVTEFVDSFLEENDCPMKTQMQIDLALEEAYVNIANYAYGDETGKAEIGISKNGDEVTIVLKDGGIPYNPLEKKDPDTTLSAEEREIGGLGVFLVKKNMDSVFYEYRDGKNIFTMTKKI